LVGLGTLGTSFSLCQLEQGGDAGMAWSGEETTKGWRQRTKRAKQHGADLGKATKGSAGRCTGLFLARIRPVSLFIVV